MLLIFVLRLDVLDGALSGRKTGNSIWFIRNQSSTVDGKFEYAYQSISQANNHHLVDELAFSRPTLFHLPTHLWGGEMKYPWNKFARKSVVKLFDQSVISLQSSFFR